MMWMIQEGVSLGLLPAMLSEADPRGAVEQIDAGYQHGGGWREATGFTLVLDPHEPMEAVLRYEGDPDLEVMAVGRMRGEWILVFPYDFVAVWDTAGSSVRFARID